MVQYTRGLAEVGAEIYGVADTPLGNRLRSASYLAGYLEVPRIMDEDDVLARVSAWLAARPGRPRSVELGAARDPGGQAAGAARAPGDELRHGAGLSRQGDHEGTDPGCRAAGSALASGAHRVETRAAAEEIGYPLILKPIAGAGSASTYRVTSTAELDDAIVQMRGIPEASCEEYIEGDEFTFDTVCVGGRPLYENVAAYVPKPIEMRSFEWISPVIITVRQMDQPKLAVGLELGRKVLQALQMGDGFTHMEWFLTPSGEAVFGEIALSCAGAMLVDQMNYTSDINLFREWARVICWQSFDAVAPRKYNAGVIFKRARARG